MEHWKVIEGTMGMYSVSDFGRVRNNRTGRYLKTQIIRGGHAVVGLRGGPDPKTWNVTTLVVNAFLGGRDRRLYRHKNGDNGDNRVANLEEM